MLSPREKQILERIAYGEVDREVACALGIGFSTVRKHRENIKIKLGLQKSTQLAMHYFATLPELPKKAA